MQFKDYPSYKNSGVEWLGDVPDHWQIVRTKDIFNQRKEEALADDEIVTAFRDGQVTLRKNRRTDGFTNSIKEHGYQHINSGDLVIHEMDAFAGAIGVSDSSGKSTPVYTVCYSKDQNVNHHFYSHFFRTMAKTGFINSLAKGIRVRSTEFRWNESRNVYLALPPKLDQQKIVSFLYTETARIDNLISKQERLIKLLEEQRKSIISHAVTKGLNPNTLMKDSGVEWLGEVPGHWKIGRLKNFAKVNPKINKIDVNQDQVIEFIPMTNVDEKKGIISKLDYRLFSEVSSGYTAFNSDDVVFAKITPCMENGNCAIIPKLKFGFGFGTTEFIVFRKSSLITKEYLYYFLRHQNLRDIAKQFMTGTAGQQRISSEFLACFPMALPDISEQENITSYLNVENKRLDNLVLKQSNLIEKLKEYRSSIISHAVTGKIDVREFSA